jgi:hypothetical protein
VSKNGPKKKAQLSSNNSHRMVICHHHDNGDAQAVIYPRMIYLAITLVGVKRRWIPALFLGFHHTHAASPVGKKGRQNGARILAMSFAMRDPANHVPTWVLNSLASAARKYQRSVALKRITTAVGVATKSAET